MAFEQSSSFYQTSSDGTFGFAADESDLEQSGFSTFESSSASGYGVDSGAAGFYGASANVAAVGGGFQAASSAYEFAGGNQSAAGFSASSLGQQSATSSVATSYAADAQGIFQDPNPRIIRRAATEGTKSYIQRVLVRFLQPPPLPPPGPLIIKEVRPPQPPAPPPLYIRQRPPPPPVLPPLVIREAPPKMPPAVPPQIITKTLPPLPVPPRSVIIERLPPLPPKPRDIIVERWLPYRTQHKRQVIIQRAPPPPVQKPRNIIIYYEAPKAQIVRRFLNLGIQRANPNDYVARYGAQLEDANSLIHHARQAGVVEDITPPGNSGSSSYQFGSGFSGAYESSAGVTSVSGSSIDLASASAGALSSGGLSYGLINGEASGNFSSGSYEASSASFGGNGVSSGLNFVEDLNNISGGVSSYQSYSANQSFSQ